MTSAVAELTGEQLIQHVAHLAMATRTNEAAVDELVLAAQYLAALADDPTGRHPARSSDTRLHHGHESAPIAAAAAADRMAAVMRRVEQAGCGFLAATAGQIRNIFSLGDTSVADWLGCHCLATLPRELPADDDAHVVLYATGKNEVASLLSAVGRGEDPAVLVTHLVNRAVHRHPYPWEH